MVRIIIGCDFLFRVAESSSSKIAQHISEAASEDKAIVIDCFAGVGGNAIAFAQSDRWKKVYAIERDPKVLACAKHNAELYGVQDRIAWYLGDCFKVIEDQLTDLCPYSVLFISPPWGGNLTIWAWLGICSG